MNEARQHERKAVSLRPRYRLETRLDYTESPCLDLSEGGMFIESDAPAAPGTLLKVECEGPNGVFRALGRVAWSRKSEGDAPSGMGVRFLQIEPGDASVLQSVLANARSSSAAAMWLPAARSPMWLTIAALLMMVVGVAIILIGSH